MREAAVALKRVFAADPELKAFFDARMTIPGLTRGYQQLTEAQQHGQRESARSYIGTLAKEAGLPDDSKWVGHLTRLVAGHAMGIENGNERFERGDFSVLKEAFEAVKADFLGTLSKAGTANVAQAKGKLSKLPPAPRGSAAGPEASKPIEPGKEREFTRDLHKRGLALLKERLTG